MSPTLPSERRTWPRALAAVAVAAMLVASGCARTLPESPTQGAFGPAGEQVTPSPTGVATATASPTGSPTATATPTTTPTAKPTPTDPWKALSAKTRKEFKNCRTTTVGPGSSGACALLVIRKLKAAKYYPWATTSRINQTSGANAILNYQRSRGLPATGIVAKKTWLALASRAPVVPTVLPKKCLTKGVVICVDQAHRKLFWLKDGEVKKTVKVRVGGYNYLKKKKQKKGVWRIYGTANGTWKVYDKQVDPPSENYGSGAMPYSVMFYPDMYVHYSPGFHAVGYAGSSHGCVNVGSLTDAIWIFRHTPIGAKVHVFSPTVT
ncbi:L,D-transpeptidase family protein [Propionicimonas sp.]|uniref:L,D-transpeptidase family protein n=1 Tax=Propionicimonas sp. TaxID=1955623 RepID=UPI0039E3914F